MKYVIESYRIDSNTKQLICFDTSTRLTATRWVPGTLYMSIKDLTDNANLNVTVGSEEELKAVVLELMNIGKINELAAQIVEKAPAQSTAVVGNYSADCTAKHYQGYFEIPELHISLQWIDAIKHTGRFKDPDVFEACLELLVRNYLDRLGRKDDKLQELKKARWYLDYWIKEVESSRK